jgi:hypothetical protein
MIRSFCAGSTGSITGCFWTGAISGFEKEDAVSSLVTVCTQLTAEGVAKEGMHTGRIAEGVAKEGMHTGRIAEDVAKVGEAGMPAELPRKVCMPKKLPRKVCLLRGTRGKSNSSKAKKAIYMQTP